MPRLCVCWPRRLYNRCTPSVFIASDGTRIAVKRSYKKRSSAQLRQLERYDPVRSGDNIFPWLTGLARNEISRALAQDRHDLSLETLWARIDQELLPLYARLDAEPFDDDLLQREQTCELVNMTMSQLPPHYREALEAKYVRGLSVRDLAALGRSTEKAMESQLSRARKAFRVTFLTLSRNLGAEPS